eukprot:3646119-Pyramimonas_sp.AAC.1
MTKHGRNIVPRQSLVLPALTLGDGRCRLSRASRRSRPPREAAGWGRSGGRARWGCGDRSDAADFVEASHMGS